MSDYVAQSAELRERKTRNPSKHPVDVSFDTVTEIAKKYNADCPDPRLKFVIETLLDHLHDFARKVDLTTDEWMAGIQFLTKVGQTCTDVRQEFILLSDILGVSALVDSLNHPKPPSATEATVLGPFFTTDAADVGQYESIVSQDKVEESGHPLLVKGRILGLDGQSIPNARIETWETDATGHYDTQYDDRVKPDCRGRLHADGQGNYAFRAIKPVSYPIPSDGPVGSLLLKLGRHTYRPAHLHMMIEAQGYENLVTALYPDDDKYLYSDAVFGVKTSLICKITTNQDDAEARKAGFKRAPFHELTWDFFLLTEQQARKERERASREAREK